MNVLAIDTASPDPAVSVARDGALHEEPLPAERRASEELLPALRRALRAAGLRLSDCDRVAVCSGPGSFTGVRVGLATAWGLARGSGVAVEAVSTLEAMAEAARPSGLSRVAAALDAGRGEAIVERFDLSGPRARSLGPASRVPTDRLAAETEGEALLIPRAEGAGPRGLALSRRPASALALAVARSPREASVSMAPANYARPSAAAEAARGSATAAKDVARGSATAPEGVARGGATDREGVERGPS